MMEAKELRISNFVEWIHPSFKKYYFKVTDIGIAGINQYTNHFRVYSELCGIPITEEILLKCGFKYDCDLVNSLCKCGIWFNKKNMESTYLSQKLIKINYLHQLQNLYWCLCEEELEVNL